MCPQNSLKPSVPERYWSKGQAFSFGRCRSGGIAHPCCCRYPFTFHTYKNVASVAVATLRPALRVAKGLSRGLSYPRSVLTSSFSGAIIPAIAWQSPLTSQGSQSKTQKFWIRRGILPWSASPTGSTLSAFSRSSSAASPYSWSTRVSIGVKLAARGLLLYSICHFPFIERTYLAGGEAYTFSQRGFGC